MSQAGGFHRRAGLGLTKALMGAVGVCLWAWPTVTRAQQVVTFTDSYNHFENFTSGVLHDGKWWVGGNGFSQGYLQDNIAAGPIGNWFGFLDVAQGAAKTSTGEMYALGGGGIHKFGFGGMVSAGVISPTGLAMIEVWGEGKLYSFATGAFSPVAVIRNYNDGVPVSTLVMPIIASSADFFWELGIDHGYQVLVADANKNTVYQVNLGKDLANPQWNVVMEFLCTNLGSGITELHYHDGKAYVTTGDEAASGAMTLAPNPPDPCDPDCDQSGTLSIDDFICFQTLFALGDPEGGADCDADAALTIDDFICFQTFFAIGC